MKRWIAILLCAVLLAGAVGSVSAAALPSESGLVDEEWEVLLLTNRERLKKRLDPLTTTPFLQEATDIRAEEISASFSHDRPDGSSFFTVLNGRKYTVMGENIAAGYRTPAAAVNGWMKSEGHRRNILNADYRHVGVGFYYLSGSKYGDHWVQLFYTGPDCAYTAMRLVGSGSVSTACASIDDARLTLALDCGCGTAYLPLMKEFCTGFTAGQAGEQTLTISCCDMTAEITVTVSEQAETEPPADDPAPSGRFSDIPAKAWYAEAVDYAVEKKWMNGVGDGKFDPEGTMTRAMLVTVLWRDASSPAAGVNRFTDVPNGSWYTPAVTWAADAKVVTGTSDSTFDPNGNITREQMATILYRYAQKSGFDTSTRGNLSGFPDAATVSSYAKEAVAWAVGAGLINGSDGKLLPKGNATRAQVSAILMRYDKNIAKAD